MSSVMNDRAVALHLCLGVVSVGLFAASGNAAILDVPLNDTNAKDNFLYNNGPTSNFAGSGLFYYDNRQAQLDKARPIIGFDLPTLPAGSTITNVKLRLTTQQYTFIDVNNASAVVPWNFSVHQMLTDWSETTSNWNERSAGNPWSAPGLSAGADYAAAPTATVLVNSPTTGGTQLFWDITALYLNWVGGSAQNYGLSIQGPAGDPTRDTNGGDTTDGVFRCYNTEFANDSLRPHLIIEYIPAPGSAAALAMGVMAAGRRRRALR